MPSLSETKVTCNNHNKRIPAPSSIHGSLQQAYSSPSMDMKKIHDRSSETLPILPRHKKAQGFRAGDQSWRWELVALTTCVTSLLAIMITVSIRHGKPPPSFPLGNTLNAVVPIFSTITKTTMLYCAAKAISQSKWIWLRRKALRLSDIELYDQASRGPCGSLTILARVHWTYGFWIGSIWVKSFTVGSETGQPLEPSLSG